MLRGECGAEAEMETGLLHADLLEVDTILVFNWLS